METNGEKGCWLLTEHQQQLGLQQPQDDEEERRRGGRQAAVELEEAGERQTELTEQLFYLNRLRTCCVYSSHSALRGYYGNSLVV